MNCKMYSLAICVFSVFFLLYLFFLVAFNSETLYIEVHNRVASAFALFLSAMIYACLAGYLYWDLFINVGRKEQLRRWVEARRLQTHEREMDQRQIRGRQSG